MRGGNISTCTFIVKFRINMNSKSLLIAIAAFAVTTTGAQAFAGTTFLSRSGLNEAQAEAFTEARELRSKGKNEEARDLLIKAGIDEEALNNLRTAARASHEAVESAITSRDFPAFKEAVAGTPLYDLITTEEDFLMFVEAHDLKLSGNYTESRTILNELGVSPRLNHGYQGYGRKFHDRQALSDLSEVEQDALRVARQANDSETVHRILEEAGLSDNWVEQKREKRERNLHPRQK